MATPTSLQDQMIALVRSFGLHRAEETPCGQPVTVAEAYALMELSLHVTLSQNELVDLLNLAKSTVSRLVQGMERRGWVTRIPNPHDGRGKLLRLTDKGIQTAEQVATAREEKFAKILNHISLHQQAQVADALAILVKAVRHGDQ